MDWANCKTTRETKVLGFGAPYIRGLMVCTMTADTVTLSVTWTSVAMVLTIQDTVKPLIYNVCGTKSQIECLLSNLADVFAQSTEARC